MLAAATAAAAAIWVTTAWLLGTANDATAGTERAKVRVDAVRTGLAAGAGAAAVVTLGLAFRRQEHQEYDTAERRVTELYNAAAEQLGSDKAPVRLTALYTLERLANDNPAHRQTIVNIVCAYLRMPYTPPKTSIGPREEPHAASRRYHTARAATRAGTWPAAPQPPTAGPDPHEEHQVRLTAQRILHTHLHCDAPEHWTGLNLDLTGATLIDFALTECTLTHADFRAAVFSGYALFDKATFSGSVFFDEATFSKAASFEEATFSGYTTFSKVAFEYAVFDKATFSRSVFFDEATFSEKASFEEATFSGYTIFGKVTFPGRRPSTRRPSPIPPASWRRPSPGPWTSTRWTSDR
ncbi:pentapeptide repeat-containing protein [Spirillospora sp. NPDC048911]|uniref:pentapeptide repeat-containing protein n=1 Tax=Spirillospora sp. NPDC048911 TaxID=3364527 RepID=UPI00371289AC